MSTSAINAALRARFCPPEWALFFEVADATGARQNRWADAVAMNLYPSRGLSICGFEVKVSRSDWLRELKTPSKSEPVQQYCDTWAIVTLAGVVKDGELPPTWGLYELDAGKLRQKVPSPALKPLPVTKAFVAAMLRRASEIDHGEVAAAVHKEVERRREADLKNNEREIARRSGDTDKIKQRAEEIKKLCGIDLLHGYEDLTEVAKAFRLARDTGLAAGYHGLATMAGDLERTAARVRTAIKEFELPEVLPARPSSEIF